MSQLGGDERRLIAAAIIVNDGHVLLVRRRVDEGELSWQFPVGEVETRENGDDAAVREAREETGLTVRAIGSLGRRVHPHTGRTILYVACDVRYGTAYVGDDQEIAEVTWCDRAALAARIPYRLHGPVQAYLDMNLR